MKKNSNKTKDKSDKAKIGLPPELIPAHVKVIMPGNFFIGKELSEKFFAYAKYIISSDLNTRIIAQDLLKGRDYRYFPGQGSVFLPFILQNRKAIKQLVGNLNGSTILFAPERGGGLVLDHIKSAHSCGIESVKIPKFPQKTLDDLELQQAINEFKQYPWSSLHLKKLNGKENEAQAVLPYYSKKEQSKRLEQAIISAITAGHRTIGLVDAMIGGSSGAALVETAQKILAEYPEIRFSILLHQHTIERNFPYGHAIAYPLPYAGGYINLDPVLYFSIQNSTIEKPNFTNKSEEEKKQLGLAWKKLNEASYGTITIANGNTKKAASDFNLIIGEDINFQFLYDPTDANAQKPFFIFDVVRGELKLIMLQPGGSLTARDAIELLIAGAFDEVLNRNGLLIQETPKLSTDINDQQCKIPDASLFRYANKRNLADLEEKRKRTQERIETKANSTLKQELKYKNKNPSSFNYGLFFTKNSSIDTSEKTLKKILSKQNSNFYVIAFSLDFDGCLDSVFKDKDKYSQFKAHITQYIKAMVEKIPDKEIKIEILLGTQRQSLNEECRMLMGGHSTCPNIYLKFTEDLNEAFKDTTVKINFNKFLLGDMFKNLEPGKTFAQMTELEDKLGESQSDFSKKKEKIEKLTRLEHTIEQFKITLGKCFTEHPIEHSKLLLSYVQMHYLSSLYGAEIKINLRLIDDKKVEILSKLNDFFQKHQDWIPNNLELTLLHCSKKQVLPTVESTLQGTGTINPDYASYTGSLLSNFNRCQTEDLNRKQLKFINYCDTFSPETVAEKTCHI